MQTLQKFFKDAMTHGIKQSVWYRTSPAATGEKAVIRILGVQNFPCVGFLSGEHAVPMLVAECTVLGETQRYTMSLTDLNPFVQQCRCRYDITTKDTIMKTKFLRFLSASHLNGMNAALYSNGAIKIENVASRGRAVSVWTFDSPAAANLWYESLPGSGVGRLANAIEAIAGLHFE